MPARTTAGTVAVATAKKPPSANFPPVKYATKGNAIAIRTKLRTTLSMGLTPNLSGAPMGRAQERSHWPARPFERGVRRHGDTVPLTANAKAA
jgi:hypothetical protein